MADTKISALTAVTTLTGASELPVNEAGTSKKATVTQLINNLNVVGQRAVAHLGVQHSISSATPTKVTGLDLTLPAAGTYVFEYTIIEQSATITVAPQYNFNFTGTTTKSRWWFQYADLSSTLLAAIGTVSHNVSTTTLGFQMAQSEDTEATSATGNMHPFATTNAVQTINTDIMVKITGIIVTADSGNLELWHGSETATATSVEVGSSLVVTRTN